MPEKSIWTSILTFAETERAAAPLLYQDEDHVPVYDDPRGGRLDVAQVDPDADLQPGELPSLRVSASGKEGSGVVVIDGYQAAILVNAVRGWLDREVPMSG